MLELDEKALRDLVSNALGHPPESIEEMPGGASTRRYLRIATPKGGAVAMFVPDATPEEVTDAATAARPWPFLEVHELLASRGVRVPKLLARNEERGLLLLEDLGDDTLAAVIAREPSRREPIYRQAVEDLARAQAALEALPKDSIVGTRAFDEKLLRWELEHFREWGLEAQGLEQRAEERSRMDAIFDRLAKKIASFSRGFVHRDYQSRNLMVKGGELVWIDFQDALLGPRAYDLVALLCDSYQTIDRPFIEARLDEYAKTRGLSAQGREDLGREFDVLTVQRKLKDAGRFVFIDRVKKNPGFLPYIAPSLGKVRAALARLEGEEDMRSLVPIVERALAHAG